MTKNPYEAPAEESLAVRLRPIWRRWWFVPLACLVLTLVSLRIAKSILRPIIFERENQEFDIEREFQEHERQKREGLK